MNIINSMVLREPIQQHHLHTHEFWEIILNLSGTNVSPIDGVEYVIAPNDVMVIPPGVVHGGDGRGDSYTDIFVSAERLGFNGVHVVHDYEGNLTSLMFTINKLITERENNFEAIADALLEVICQYIKKYSGMSYRYSFIAEVKNLMFVNLSNPDFKIGELAESFGYSQNYFRRCFEADVGITPVKYLTNLRITEAKKLLLQSYMTIAEIASSCGFSDIYYFSKKFRQETGITPREYRRQPHDRIFENANSLDKPSEI